MTRRSPRASALLAITAALAPALAAASLRIDAPVYSPRASVAVSGVADGRGRLEIRRRDGTRAARPITVTARGGGFVFRLPPRLTAPGWYELVVTGAAGEDRAPLGVFPRSRPPRLPPIRDARVRDDGVVLINGRPFFPLDLLHGSAAWLASVPLPSVTSVGALLDEIRRMGFNVAGEAGDVAHIDTHWRRHRLYTLDRRLGAGIRPSGAALDLASIEADVAARWKRRGFHPGWLGGGLADEPDLAVVHGRATVSELNAGLAALATLLPGRLVHGELSNEAAALARDLAPLDALTIGFAADPAEVATLVERTVAATRGRTRGASPWATVQLMAIDGEAAPGPWQVRAAVWTAVIHGAKGLELYPYHQGDFVWRRSPGVWAVLPAVLREVRDVLAPFALARDTHVALAWRIDGATVPRAIHAAARRSGKRTIILAVNGSAHDTVRVRFEVDGLGRRTRVRVLHEDRAIAAAAGAFSDVLGPFDTRAYEIDE